MCVFTQWQKADGDNRKVEQVPALAEVFPGPIAAGRDLEHDFAHEDPQDDLLNDVNCVAGRSVLAEGWIGLKADEDARQDDHRKDEAVEPGGMDEVIDFFDHGCGSWI